MMIMIKTCGGETMIVIKTCIGERLVVSCDEGVLSSCLVKRLVMSCAVKRCKETRNALHCKEPGCARGNKRLYYAR